MMQTDFVHGLFGVVPSNIRAFRTDSRNNYVSTADTIAEMKRVAISSSQHPVVIQAVNIALRNLPSDASLIEQSAAIFSWVKSHVRFVKHEQQQYELFGLGPDNQLLITPERLLTMPNPSGDCANYSMLLAAMLISLGWGLGISFVTVGADPNEPQRYSHVYVIAKYPCGKVISLDGSHGDYFGWETQDVSKKKEWNVMPLIRAGHAGYGSRQLGVISARGMRGMGQSGEVAVENVGVDYGSIDTTLLQQAGGNVLPSYTPPPSINGGQLLTTAINTGINTTAKILTAQYGGPTAGLQPGQTYQTIYNPKTGMYEQVASSAPTGSVLSSSLFGGTDSSTLLLLLGVGLIVLMSAGGKK